MQGAFYGIGAAVIAIIGRSAFKLVKLTLARDSLLWIVFIVNTVVTAWTEAEIIWVFLMSGLVTLFIMAPPGFGSSTTALAMAPWWTWSTTGLHGPADEQTIGQIGWYFTKAGAFVFGSGLAIVPFL